MSLCNRKIDIIIPAYNVPDNMLRRALASIASQNMIQDIEVTIVDDASTIENYENIINPFKVFFPIRILKNQINGGPGVARQNGINNTNNEYIIFMDADDTFYDCFSVQHLRNGIEAKCTQSNNHYQVAAGSFIECINEHKNYEPNDYMDVIMHAGNFIHVFSKIYRRSFIEQYQIQFHPTSRANEDTGFNTIISLIGDMSDTINFIDEVVYCWRENPNSITRQNKSYYSFGCSADDNFGGYIENTIYAQKIAEQKAPDHVEQFKQWSIRTIIFCYKNYIENYREHKKETEQNLQWVKKYYDEIYSKWEPLIDAESLAIYYHDIMEELYSNDKVPPYVIPHITFYDYLNKVKKLPKKRH